MGRITVSVEIANPARDGDAPLRVDALVDTGATHLTLPMAWKDRLGPFSRERETALQTATQEIARGTICYPVYIKVEGFEEIGAEVLFLEMTADDGRYEPLLGYLPLEACRAAVDMLGHRLVPVKYFDLKKCAARDP